MVEGLSRYFHWHLDAFLLSIALEGVTIERFKQSLPAEAKERSHGLEAILRRYGHMGRH
jgi:hypothetical protein